MAAEHQATDDQTYLMSEKIPLNLQLKGAMVLAQAESTTAAPSASESGGEKTLSEAEEQAAIAEALANPLSYLWLMFTQNDTTWYDGDIMDQLGEDAKIQNTTMLQPVMSFQLTDKWKSIVRPVIQINSFETVGNVDIASGSVGDVTGVDFDRKTGLGDMVLFNAYSNQYKPPFIWGFGPTIMLPTATEDQLGTGKYSAGPMAMVVGITDKWIVGGILQHWWSFAGEDHLTIDTSSGPVSTERSDVALTDLQYILRYRYSALTNIGIAPNIQYNWETDELSLPVGIGFDTLIKIGPAPVKIGAEIHYYAVQDDDFGPEWRLRLFFCPVLPSPKWSQSPVF